MVVGTARGTFLPCLVILGHVWTLIQEDINIRVQPMIPCWGGVLGCLWTPPPQFCKQTTYTIFSIQVTKIDENPLFDTLWPPPQPIVHPSCSVFMIKPVLAFNYRFLLLNIISFPFYSIEESLVEKDPVLSKEDYYILDRRRAYERGLQKGLRITELVKEHRINDPNDQSILGRYR